jgi:hypothetical protein
LFAAPASPASFVCATSIGPRGPGSVEIAQVGEPTSIAAADSVMMRSFLIFNSMNHICGQQDFAEPVPLVSK